MTRGFAVAGILVAALGATFSVSPEETGIVAGTVSVEGARPEGAVVYLVGEAVRGSLREEVVIIDQRQLRFVPNVRAVSIGGTVSFKNSDPLLHNIFSPHPEEPFDLGTYPEGESREHRFERPGPHLILCNIHPEMEAYVYVTPPSRHAVTDPDGRFTIAGVPAGTYELHVWHRRAAPHVQVVVVSDGEGLELEIRVPRAGGD